MHLFLVAYCYYLILVSTSFLLLVVRPLLLVAMPGAPSSVLVAHCASGAIHPASKRVFVAPAIDGRLLVHRDVQDRTIWILVLVLGSSFGNAFEQFLRPAVETCGSWPCIASLPSVWQ